MCGKTRKTDDPYEVWTGANGFEWRVLKKYQNAENEAKNPHARWVCAVKRNYTYGSCELGDVYGREIKRYGCRRIAAYTMSTIGRASQITRAR